MQEDATTTPDTPAISATEPDWSREKCGLFAWRPGRQLLKNIRLYQRYQSRRGPWALLMRMHGVFWHRFWSVVTSCDVPLNCQLEGGLILAHCNGVVIHPESKVGPNCLLFHQVTLGKGGPKPGAPILDGHVDIGAGAKILGGVTLGDHSKVGANAVVLCDVPAGATAVGIPAKIIEA